MTINRQWKKTISWYVWFVKLGNLEHKGSSGHKEGEVIWLIQSQKTNITVPTETKKEPSGTMEIGNNFMIMFSGIEIKLMQKQVWHLY